MNVVDWMLLIMRVRSSYRDFKEGKLGTQEKDVLIRSIDSGPSSGGLRAYSVWRTESERKKGLLQEATLNQRFVSKAAIIFCICADPDKSKEKYGDRGWLYSIQDATIAGMCITFAATALGLGSCWVGSIDEKKVRKIYNISENHIPLSLICIGKK